MKKRFGTFKIQFFRKNEEFLDPARFVKLVRKNEEFLDLDLNCIKWDSSLDVSIWCPKTATELFLDVFGASCVQCSIFCYWWKAKTCVVPSRLVSDSLGFAVVFVLTRLKSWFVIFGSQK